MEKCPFPTPMHKTIFMRYFIICLIVSGCMACRQQNGTDVNFPVASTENQNAVSKAAILLTKAPFVTYDPAYQSIPYPNGDVAPDRGVCADVVVRALRAVGHDLQQLIHEDMRANFSLYPKKWSLRAPDPNIDHRRVPNLMTFFERFGQSLATEENIETYLPGDIVTWELSSGRPHIGIVVDGFGTNGWPLVVHNIGGGQEKANVLFNWKITGHYRYINSIE